MAWHRVRSNDDQRFDSTPTTNCPCTPVENVSESELTRHAERERLVRLSCRVVTVVVLHVRLTLA